MSLLVNIEVRSIVLTEKLIVNLLGLIGVNVVEIHLKVLGAEGVDVSGGEACRGSRGAIGNLQSVGIVVVVAHSVKLVAHGIGNVGVSVELDTNAVGITREVLHLNAEPLAALNG